MTRNHLSPLSDDVAQQTASPSDRRYFGMMLLCQAFTYAKDAGTDLWNFALEIDTLYDAGLTVSDLRWLVAKGFVAHGRETTRPGDHHRSFCPRDGFHFERATCMVLTPHGAAFISQASKAPDVFSLSVASNKAAAAITDAAGFRAACTSMGESDKHQPGHKPHWNLQRRELWLDKTIVKRFRVPARNQQRILCAFQEEEWPEHIDDPLPVSVNVDAHTRLHDAINRLNGHQTHSLIRFRGNGNGTGVSWELRNSR